MNFHEHLASRAGLLLVLMSLAGSGLAVEAHMYRCKDENGRVYYTDRPGVGCAGQETDEMSRQGLILERPDAIRPKESAEEREKRLAQERSDRALLQTYKSEEQIESAKQRSLQTPLLAVKYAKKKLAAYTERLFELRDRETKMSDEGETVPLSLIEDIDATLSDIARLENDLETKQRSVDRIVDRYEADKERYRELVKKGGQ
jgi:hypothetical protein